MKTILTSVLVAVWFCVSAFAQTASLPPVSIAATGGEKIGPYAVVERGDHHRVWQRVTVATNSNGNTISRTNAVYTELETGMNVKQPDGTWVEASEEIEIIGTGAIAQKTRHRVSFAVNCNSPVAIDLVTADGKRLQSRILGLAYFDTATGQSVLIAEIKNSDGQLLMEAKNEVIYYDAFTGFKADVRYHNRKAGLEQDIILRENPPSPAAYNLNPATTVLEVLTEFFNPPVPAKIVRVIDGTVDEFLDFGDLKMGRGRVFVMGAKSTEIPVTKQWGTLSGRTFLIEEIPYTSVEPELKTLPGRTASLTSPDGVLHQVSVKRLLPAVKPAKKAPAPMKVASAPLSGQGVVLDYTTASSSNNFTFQGDTTYYVSGTVNLGGPNTTFESGTVIKYAPTNTPKLNITSPITWQGSAYRPVVMTARDDDTVGETISGSTGNPNTNYFANPALYIDGTAAGTNAVLQSLRIAYAQSAIVFNGSTGHIVSHAQLVNCANGIAATNADFSLRNALLYNVLTNFNGASATGRCEHLTIDTANWLNNNSAITLTMTNSLLVGVTNAGTFTSNSVSTGTSAAFVTVGAASHYLADNTYRNAGTTNINATLANDLQNRTTYPPIELTNNFTVNTVLAPQAQRDMDVPDLGYHYDPLDYVVSGRTLSANLTLTNGVALGTYGSSYGLKLSSGSLVSEGTPPRLNWIARYNTVQEQSTANWSASTVGIGVWVFSSPVPVRVRFTGWSLLAGVGEHFNDGSTSTTPTAFSHSRFAGGKFTVWPSSTALTNCVWERVFLTLNDSGYDLTWYLFNNLFFRGNLIYRALGNNPVLRAYDNLFDNTWIGRGFFSASFTGDYNGYVTNCSRLTTGAHDVLLTNSPVYQTSYLGNYYYPTNDGNVSRLIDAGSRTAAAATLYHFTTTTNQVKEATSQVDIGFHYVAVDGNGNPIDTNGNGVPDYLEDRNGNGTVDSGETDWQSATDLGLKVLITRPRSGAILP